MASVGRLSRDASLEREQTNKKGKREQKRQSISVFFAAFCPLCFSLAFYS
jgi:hypothetical protein